MSTGLKANPDGSAAIQVGGTDVITLTSGGAATFVTSPTTVQAGTAAAPSITTSGDTNTGIFFPAADTIAFAEGGAEALRINSSGTVVLTGGDTSANGTGITFPATQSASSNANTLDDYEEGTYTPIPNPGAGAITSYTSNGKYTKIGNVVSVFGIVGLTTVGTASGQLQITLPFNPNYTAGADQPATPIRESAVTGTIYFGVVSTSSNKITVQNSTNGGIAWVNGYVYSFQITYFV